MTERDGLVSVVLPVFNERGNLAPLLSEIDAALDRLEYEVVAVDDGSTDGSLELLESLRGRFPRLRVVKLEHNSGQSAAFAAGLDASRGDVLVTLDADGQNDPADIPKLLDPLHSSGVSAVVGYRVRRADSVWKLAQSRIANAFRNLITGDSVRDTGCSLKAIKRDVLLRVYRFNGMHRFLPTLIRMQGRLVVEVPVSHRDRKWGHSKYGMWNRVFRGLRDAFGVRWLKHRVLRYTVKQDIG